MPPRTSEATGVLFGVAAYSVWGFAAAYWKAVGSVPAAEVLAHRVLWSLVVALLLLAWTRGFPEWRASLRNSRHALPVAMAALLLGVNWLVFIYAVGSDQVLATSLGYYLNPLFNVVLGLVVLRERLRRLQWLAVSVAGFGVGYYIVSVGELPWIALVLAGSFGLYGLVRKATPVSPIIGFGVEMALLAVPAALYIAWLVVSGAVELPVGELGFDLLVAGSGLITAVPLLCFNAAAKRLQYVTVGILQYIAPSLTLVLAVVAYGEPFSDVHAVTFGCVWLALGLFTTEALLFSRRAVVEAPA